ncbi:MAG: molybdenum cofactor biosynthesis protein MoaE, partial [Gammaproteobacteria bacterium]|nr:molybdenum cofactor biosynthesis protein MoaE [Gammaproteobacteria bacterium]
MHSVRVQEEDFALHVEWQACRERLGGKAGAVVSFIGLVRE